MKNFGSAAEEVGDIIPLAALPTLAFASGATFCPSLPRASLAPWRLGFEVTQEVISGHKVLEN